MSTSTARAIAPTIQGNMPTIPRYIITIESALRNILQEVAPGQRPYSGDSYLPEHMVNAAREALADHDKMPPAAHQITHNGLSTAAWHIARGEPGKALARLRRVQAHIKHGMEASAAPSTVARA